tara:strand:+ start:5141 stop:6040 length:900 start_codon:yes stop_codon:yes gene_type:complete
MKSDSSPWRKIVLRAVLFVLGGVLGWIVDLAGRQDTIFRPSRLTDAAGKIGPEVNLLTWNILRGKDERWMGAPWSLRQPRFAEALRDRDFDVVCLQEALPDQIRFFESLFVDYQRVSRSRDGGEDDEHCPIFVKKSRFEVADSGTFWFSPTPDVPGLGWGERVPRICTWAELSDRQTGFRFRIYNVHLHLHPVGQIRAAKLLAERIEVVQVPVIVAGDFNSPATWRPVRILRRTGLREADISGALTYIMRDKSVRRLDHILIDNSWDVLDGEIVKLATPGVAPSDHLGLTARLVNVAAE